MQSPIPQEEEQRMFNPQSNQHPPSQESTGMFAKKPSAPDTSGIRNDMLDLTRRLRPIEEQNSLLRKRLQMIEQNMVLNDKKGKDDNHSIQIEVDDLRHQMHELETNFRLMIKELQNTAKKEEFIILKKYVEMWQPIRFVTYEEVMKIINEKMNEHRNEEKQPEVQK